VGGFIQSKHSKALAHFADHFAVESTMLIIFFSKNIQKYSMLFRSESCFLRAGKQGKCSESCFFVFLQE